MEGDRNIVSGVATDRDTAELSSVVALPIDFNTNAVRVTTVTPGQAPGEPTHVIVDSIAPAAQPVAVNHTQTGGVACDAAKVATDGMSIGAAECVNAILLGTSNSGLTFEQLVAGVKSTFLDTKAAHVLDVLPCAQYRVTKPVLGDTNWIPHQCDASGALRVTSDGGTTSRPTNATQGRVAVAGNTTTTVLAAAGAGIAHCIEGGFLSFTATVAGTCTIQDAAGNVALTLQIPVGTFLGSVLTLAGVGRGFKFAANQAVQVITSALVAGTFNLTLVGHTE